MERYKLKHVLLSDEDLRVLRESLAHSSERDDLPNEDLARLQSISDRLAEWFKPDAH